MLTTAIALLWTAVLAQGAAALPPAVFVGSSDIDAVVASSTANNRLDSKITEAAIPGGIFRI